MSPCRTVDCRRCGACCQVDFRAFVTEADVARWRAEQRRDLLALLRDEEVVWAGDHLVGADGRDLGRCPFLAGRPERRTCLIYATRPRTCRDFQPGSSSLCSQRPG